MSTRRERRKTKKESWLTALKNFLAVSMFFISCVLVAVLSMISVELALFCTAVLVVGCFFQMFNHKHNDLGVEIIETIQKINQSQNRLEKMVAEHQQDLVGIREDLEEESPNIGRHMPDRKAMLNFRARMAGVAHKDDEDSQGKEAKSGIVPAFLKPTSPPPVPSNDLYPQKAGKAYKPSSLFDERDAMRVPPILYNDPDPFEDGSLSDMVIRELLYSAARTRKVDVFLQPIMRLPQRHAKFYEIFARIRARAGVYLPASRYMQVASQENLMETLDNILLVECLKALKKNYHSDKISTYFINVSPSTLRNTAFMADLLRFMAKNKEMASSLVFEIRQSDFFKLTSGETRILEALAQLGCAFSLDNISELPNDLLDLHRKNVKYVKVKAETFLSKSKESNNFAEMVRRKCRLETHGINVIIDRIEDEPQLLELLDYEINYGQGYLLGRPDLEGVYQYKKTA